MGITPAPRVGLSTLVGLWFMAGLPLHAAVVQVPTLPVDTVQAVEVLRIGSIDGPDALTDPGRMVMQADGTAYVYFVQEDRVRTIRPDGTLGGSFGRAGQGPGEFHGFQWNISLAGGRLWLNARERVTWFDLESGEADTFIPRVPVRGVRGVISMFPFAVLPDESIVFAPGPSALPIRPGEEIPAPFAMLRPGDPPRLDTIGTQIIRHDRLLVREPGTTGPGYSVLRNPFTMSDLVDIHAAHPAVVFVDPVAAMERRSVVVRMVGADGAVMREREIGPLGDPRVTRSELDAAIDYFSGQLMDGTLAPPSRAVGREWLAHAFGNVTRKPVVTDVRATSDGRIWLQMSGHPVHTPRSMHYQSGPWLILDADLNPVRWVRFPHGSRLLDAYGDTAWVAERGEFDVPYLVKYRIAP